MPLTVEDGTIVPDADSYIDLAYARTFAASCGLKLPTDDTMLEQMLRKATRYIDSRRSEFTGSKVSASQSLQWPRSGACLDGLDLEEDFIPKEIRDAAAQLAVEQHAGVPLFPSPISTNAGGTGQVEELTAGPLTIKYDNSSATTSFAGDVDLEAGVKIASVETLLEPLFGKSGLSGIEVCRA